MSGELAKRRAFFNSQSPRGGPEKVSWPIRFACPCCGYPTLEDERSNYDICGLCYWEDDGQDDADADEVRGGPNHEYSLSEARQNFVRFLTMLEPGRGGAAGRRESEEAQRLKRELITVFDEMTRIHSESELEELWRQVERYERAILLCRSKLPLPK
jgi:hypothetical protein